MASEAEIARLQNEIIQLQKGQEAEFRTLGAEIERLRSELAQKGETEQQLALEREQHEQTKAQLYEAQSAASAAEQKPQEAATADVEALQRHVKQLEKALDNSLRLQTRAELSLQQTATEAKREMEQRRRVERMMQQLMDRLTKLPEPRKPNEVVFSQMSAKSHRASRKTSSGVLL